MSVYFKGERVVVACYPHLHYGRHGVVTKGGDWVSVYLDDEPTHSGRIGVRGFWASHLERENVVDQLARLGAVMGDGPAS